jgi:hypothetical protein
MTELIARYDRSHAVVIGINKYADPHFKPGGDPVAAAKTMAKVLAARPHHFEAVTLFDKQASRQAILDALAKLTTTAAHDRVLVVFTGAAYALRDRFGKEQAYLAAADTKYNDDASAISVEDLTGWWPRAGARHIAFFLDAPVSREALGLTHAAPTADPVSMMEKSAIQAVSAANGGSIADPIVEALSLPEGIPGLYTLTDLGFYLQRGRGESAHGPQFGHLPGSQFSDMVFYPRTDRDPSPLSTANEFQDGVGPATITAYRTESFDRAEADARRAALKRPTLTSKSKRATSPLVVIILAILVLAALAAAAYAMGLLPIP